MCFSLGTLLLNCIPRCILLQQIIAFDGNLMTSSNLGQGSFDCFASKTRFSSAHLHSAAHSPGTAVGPTIFPALPIQKCAVLMEFMVHHYHAIFDGLESGKPDFGDVEAIETSTTAPVTAAPIKAEPAAATSPASSTGVDRQRLTALLRNSTLDDEPAATGAVMRF